MKNMRAIAFVLLFTMMFNIIPIQAFAEEVQNGYQNGQQLEEELRTAVNEAEYPNGLFEFLTTRMNTSEKLGSVEFAVVRKGGTAGKASIAVKAIDVSAKYGEDYTVSVQKGVLWETLPENKEARPLMDSIANMERVNNPTVTEEVYKAGGAAYETDPEAEEEAVPGEIIQSTTGGQAVTVTEEVYTELKALKPAAKATSLREAREAFTGKVSDRKDWREAEQTEKERALDSYRETYESIPGVICTLEFEDGEYMKKLRFNTMDDKISEDEEQVLLVLLDSDGASAGASISAFMNIEDNEEKEKVEFEIAEKEISVNRSFGFAEVTVKRTSGLYRYGSISVGTAALTAKPETDYSPIMTELRFVPGQKTQRVRVPILDNGNKEELQFLIKLDNDSPNLSEQGNPAARVTIEAAPERTAGIDYKSFGALSDSTASLLKAGSYSTMAGTAWQYADGKWYDGDKWYKAKALGIGNVVNSNCQYKWPDKNFIYMEIYESLRANRHVVLPVDLTMVDKIKWDWSNVSPGTHYTEYVAWKGYVDKYWTDFYSYFALNDSKKVTRHGTFETNWHETYPAGGVLSGEERKQKYIYFGTDTEDKTRHSTLAVGIVYLLYTPINVQLKTLVGDVDANVRTKTWTSTDSFTDDKSEYVGSLSFENDTASTQKTFYDGDVVGLTHNFAESSLDTSEVYLWGYKIERHGGLANYTEEQEDATLAQSISDINKYYYVKGDSLDIRKLYTSKMVDYKGRIIPWDKVMLEKNTIALLPIYKAKNAYVKINFNEAEGGMAQNSFSNGDTIKIGMLDTVEFNAVEKTGFAVSGYDHGHANYDNNDITSHGVERFLYSYSAADGKKYIEDNSSYLRPIDGIEINTAVPNRLLFKPRKTFSNLTVQFGSPYLEVRVHPLSSEESKTKGNIAYIPTEEGKEAKYGNYKQPLIIDPMEKNKLYTFSGIPDEGYGIVWSDKTGDEKKKLDPPVEPNPDGDLDKEEKANIKKYEELFDRFPVNGDFYNYLPQYSKPLIYYSFVRKTPNDKAGKVHGGVSLVGGSILDRIHYNSEERTPLAGIEVLINGFKTVTDSAGDFKIINNYFANNEYHTVIIDYKDIKYTGHILTYDWTPIDIMEYDSFVPGNFKIQEVKTGGNEEVVPQARTVKGKTVINKKVENKDADFSFSFDVEAKKPGLSADKALVRIYSKEGMQRGNEIEVTPKRGTFSFNFNPAANNVVPGDTMTVQFVDQNGKEYLEHQVGITFIKYLDTFTLLSSFKSPASGLIDMVGSIDAAFDLGLAGKTDDYIDKTGNEWTISFGFDKSWEKDLGEKSLSDELKSAATDSEKGGETAKKAVDKKNEEKKSASLTADMKFDLYTALYLKMIEDDTGDAYFKEMIISATVAGEFNTTAEVVTPIGVTVFIKLSLSGEINGTMVVEQYDEKKFYLNDNGEIDFSRAGTSNPDRDFTIYGKLSVKPSIGLTVGAKITGAEFSITGRAVFDMNFTTSGSGSGKVVLTANMALKVLVFDFKWDIGQKEYDLFDNNRMRRFKANDLFANTSYLYEKAEDYEISSREYLDNRGEWQGGSARRRMRLMAAGENVFNEQTLLEGVYPYPYTLLAPIGENQQLLVFLDDDTDQDDRNRTQLYYSIYNGSSWSIPEKVDNDGTPDDNPWISDMGDKVLVAWSSAVNPVDETDTVMEVLNNRDIKASFFDKGTGEFGEVQNVTFDTETDTWSDGDPYIAYWKDRNGKENLMITYTKTQYEATGGDEQDAVVGDIINAYSVLAYSFYDFDNNRFHGQGFIDVSEYADVDERDILISDNPDPDDYSGDWRWQGYWSRVPDPDEVSMASLGTDPLIVDSNAIGYEDFAILAYSIDMDRDIATTEDRELFIQLYSFPEGRFYPAIHFDDTKGQSDLEFVESNDNIYLYYISDGDIVNIDIGYLFSQNFLRYDIEGGDGHALVLNKLKGIYKKPEVAVRHKYDVRIDDSGEEYRINEYPIDQFMVKSDDNNVYVMWTESNITYRDGIDQNSNEATLPENQYREKQICAARQILGDITETKLYDEEGNPMTYPANDDEGNPIDYGITPDVNGETGIVEAGDQIVVKSREAEWSEPVKVTREKGANFNDIDFEILPDGNLRTVFVKGMSEIMDVAGTDMSVENINNRILMTADYNANAIKAEVSIEPMKMPAQNEILPVKIAMKNKTLNPLKDVTLELYQATEGSEEKIDERTAVELRGGEEQYIFFSWQAPENMEDTKLQVLVKHNEEVLCSAEQDILAESIIDIINASAAPSGRNRLKITGTAVNNGNITAADAAIYAGTSGVAAGSTAIGSLKPEEEKTFEFFAELEPDMYESITGEDGSVTEKISLNVYSNGAAAKVINERYADKDDIDIVNNIEAFELKTGNNRISNSISLRKGASLDIEPEITYNDEVLPYARTVFVSSNEDVADFSEGYMTLSGKKPGTATIAVYALPPGGRLLLTPDRYDWVDNFATLADDAVKVRSFEVNVYSDAPSDSDDKPGGGSISTSGVQSPVTGAMAADNGMAVTTAKAYADKSGKASAVITSAQISSAVGKAVAAAKQNENTVPGIEIKVEAPRDAKTIETSIPASAIKEISSSGIELMTISTPLAVIALDDRTIAGIADKASEDIKITASEVDASALPAEAQRLIGDRPVYDFGITSGGNTISEFAGNVTVSLPYTPKADEDINAIVIYYINAEGVPEVVSNCTYNEKTGTVSFKTDHFSKFAVGYNKITFRDVASNAWYSGAVSFAAARGITSGTGIGNFSPDAKLTRAQFLVMTMRAYGIRPDEKLKGNFDDAGSTYYTGYLSAAKALGIAKGTGNNLYEPDRDITRQEMFTLLYSTLKLTGQLPGGKAGKALTDFSDAGKVAPWARDAVGLFAETGVISGSNGRLSPEDTGSRAQMAQIIYNLLSR